MTQKTTGKTLSMTKPAQASEPTDERVLFLQQFLKNPKQVGSIIPSSRFLERRIVDRAGITKATMVVELGTGVGGTTRAILRALPATARLLTIEINAEFCELVRRIDDPRLIVHLGGAQDLRAILAQHRLPAPDAVVSGIPFSTMPRSMGTAITEAIAAALAPGGCFVAYQLRNHVEDVSSPVMGPAQVEMELLNIPPMRLYRWEKRGNAA